MLLNVSFVRHIGFCNACSQAQIEINYINNNNNNNKAHNYNNYKIENNTCMWKHRIYFEISKHPMYYDYKIYIKIFL